MKIFVLCLVSFFTAFCLYLLVRIIIKNIACRELRKHGAFKDSSKIEIYANVNSLEYYLRAAELCSYGEKREIAVYIRRDEGDMPEMIRIVERFSEKYDNIVKYII